MKSTQILLIFIFALFMLSLILSILGFILYINREEGEEGEEGEEECTDCRENIDCVFTSSEWDPQLCPCEGGTQVRTNTILEQSQGTGQKCPSQTETRECVPDEGREDCIEPVPQDCVVEYGEWEPLECPCGENTQKRTNTIITPSSNGGTECPEEEEERICTGPPCPINCAYTESDWENIGTCGCGGDCPQRKTYTITQQPLYGGTECPEVVKTGYETRNVSGVNCGTCHYVYVTSTGQRFPDYNINSTKENCDRLCNDTYEAGASVINCRWYQNQL